MLLWQPLQLDCKSLPAFDPNDWESIAAAFSESASCTLGQGWLKESSHLQPTAVRCGWLPDSLWVYAELSDRDIYNAATEPNQKLWELGDVFEIFLRPAAQEVWYEFHVSPENRTLQLRWPGPEETYLPVYRAQGLPAFLVDQPIFTSWTDVLPNQQVWRVLAKIPARSVAESGRIRSGDDWLFSFSRYDYTRGDAEPVVSSSSPHTVCQFDRQQEWGHLLFTG